MSEMIAEVLARVPQSGISAVAPPPDSERKGLTKKELSADHPTWCPGCGDFSVLALYFKLIEKSKLTHEQFVSIAGIGCSSRFPYFVQAHGCILSTDARCRLPAAFPFPAGFARVRFWRRRRRVFDWRQSFHPHRAPKT